MWEESHPFANDMETKCGQKEKKIHFPTVSSILRRKLEKKKKMIMVIFMTIIIIFMKSAFTLKTGIRNLPKAGLFAPSVTTTHSIPNECGCPHL
jgi:hypothetical protein